MVREPIVMKMRVREPQRLLLRRVSAVGLSLMLAVWCASPRRVAGQQGTATQPDGLEEALRLSEQVAKLYGEGKYDAAVPLAVRALSIREKALGPEHPDVATALNNLAALYKANGEYAKAEPL